MAYAIGFVVVWLCAAFQKQWWLKQAHRLAARSNIALPPYLEWRVARLLRAQWLFGFWRRAWEARTPSVPPRW